MSESDPQRHPQHTQQTTTTDSNSTGAIQIQPIHAVIREDADAHKIDPYEYPINKIRCILFASPPSSAATVPASSPPVIVAVDCRKVPCNKTFAAS